jgi:hypothetical protein
MKVVLIPAVGIERAGEIIARLYLAMGGVYPCTKPISPKRLPWATLAQLNTYYDSTEYRYLSDSSQSPSDFLSMVGWTE